MPRNNKKATLRLVALAIGMFGFAFALVPLYNVICDLTGLNGRTVTQAALLEEISPTAVPQDREVRIEFLAKAARGLPWEGLSLWRGHVAQREDLYVSLGFSAHGWTSALGAMLAAPRRPKWTMLSPGSSSCED